MAKIDLKNVLVKLISRSRFAGVKVLVSVEEYPMMAETYAKILNKHPVESVTRAINKLTESQGVFPSAGEITRCIKDSSPRVSIDDGNTLALTAGQGVSVPEKVRQKMNNLFGMAESKKRED